MSGEARKGFIVEMVGGGWRVGGGGLEEEEEEEKRRRMGYDLVREDRPYLADHWHLENII